MTRRLPAGVVVGALAVVAAGCVPTAATAEGREIQSLYQAVTVLAVLVGVFVAALITVSVIGFRRRRNDEALPVQRRGHVGLAARRDRVCGRRRVGARHGAVQSLARAFPDAAGRGVADRLAIRPDAEARRPR